MFREPKGRYVRWVWGSGWRILASGYQVGGMKGIDFVPRGLEGCRPPIDKTCLFEGLMIRTPLLILLQGRRLELGAEEEPMP